jgi:hypothetical protein
MTQRYMHLTPAALDAAIRPAGCDWRSAPAWRHRGDDGSRECKLNGQNKLLAVRQGFEPWIQVLARITV